MRRARAKDRHGFEAANAIIARIILDSVERFGGEGAGLVQWARAIVKKQDEAELFELRAGGIKA